MERLSPCGWPAIPAWVERGDADEPDDSPAGPAIRTIQIEECARAGITLREMLSERRGQRVARPRMIAMARCVDETGRSLPVIGRAFGGRDHTTVMHAYRKYGRGVQASSTVTEEEGVP